MIVWVSSWGCRLWAIKNKALITPPSHEPTPSPELASFRVLSQFLLDLYLNSPTLKTNKTPQVTLLPSTSHTLEQISSLYLPFQHHE